MDVVSSFELNGETFHVVKDLPAGELPQVIEYDDHGWSMEDKHGCCFRHRDVDALLDDKIANGTELEQEIAKAHPRWFAVRIPRVCSGRRMTFDEPGVEQLFKYNYSQGRQTHVLNGFKMLGFFPGADGYNNEDLGAADPECKTAVNGFRQEIVHASFYSNFKTRFAALVRHASLDNDGFKDWGRG